jgi:L-fuconolactonase
MMIDSHQHFWNLEQGEYPWLTPDLDPIYRTFEPPELAAQLEAAGVDGTVLVQAATSHADTDAMLRQADAYPWIRAVVGWAPLMEPHQATLALNRYQRHPRFRGVRHPVHEALQPDRRVRLIDGLRQLAERRLLLEVLATFPEALQVVAMLAESVPDLTIIVDHLANPPIKEQLLEPWASQLAAVAVYPNVYAKVSGLCTLANRACWSAVDLQPYVKHAMACFGADRLMFGSDWPVCLQAGDYARVVRETRGTLASYTRREQTAVLGGTAARIFAL